MSIGSSVFLIAVGAILRYAVTATVSGVSIQTIGLILMLAGILGLVLSLLYLFAWRARRAGGERIVERPPYEPPKPTDSSRSAHRRSSPLPEVHDVSRSNTMHTSKSSAGILAEDASEQREQSSRCSPRRTGWRSRP